MGFSFYKFRQTPQKIQEILDRVPQNSRDIAEIQRVIEQMAGGGGGEGGEGGGGSVFIHVDDELDSESTNPVENRAIALAIERLNAAVFPFSITKFAVSGATTFELGTTQSVRLEWTYAFDDITSQRIGSDILGNSLRNFTFAGVAATTTYTLRVVYKGKEYSKSASVSFKLRKWVGASVKLTDELTDADIFAMTALWADGYTMSEQKLNCSGGKYIYYVLPISKAPSGLPDFRVGGFAVSDWVTQDRTIERNGRVENYRIYRLRNIQTGASISLQVL